jgi:hypothetical protein
VQFTKLGSFVARVVLVWVVCVVCVIFDTNPQIKETLCFAQSRTSTVSNDRHQHIKHSHEGSKRFSTMILFGSNDFDLMTLF